MLQPRRSIPNQPGNMQLYDAPNCDYEPPKNFQQNFGETLNMMIVMMMMIMMMMMMMMMMMTPECLVSALR